MGTGVNRKLKSRLSRPIGRALHLFWRVSRGLTVGVRAAVIDDENRVFLIRHTYTPGWHLPGGGVEAGECVLEALRRELFEEARLAWTETPRLHAIYFNVRMSNRDHVLVYVVRTFSVIEPKRPDREIAEAGFFPLDALPQGTTGATRRRLREIASGDAPAERW